MAQSKKSAQQQLPVDDPEIRITVEKDMIGSYVQDLEKKFQSSISGTASKPVILDLNKVNQIDSCGIALCIGLYKACQTQKSEFHIEASKDSYKLFRLLKLTNVVDIREGASA